MAPLYRSDRLCGALCFLALAFLPRPGLCRAWYVRPHGTGDASSWAAAAGKLQTAIDAAAPGDEVWVAAGEYRENVTMQPGVSLLGGFSGEEGSPGQSAPALNRTVLWNVTSERIVTIPAAAVGVTVDGFTFTTAYNPSGDGMAGGIAVFAENAVITRNTFQGLRSSYSLNSPHDGSGVYCEADGVLICGNTFVGNDATSVGGAVAIRGDTVPLQNVRIERNVFRDNSALDGGLDFAVADGGAIYVSMADATIAGNVILHNGASASSSGWCHDSYCSGSFSNAFGGGLYLYACTGRIANNVIARNTLEASAGPVGIAREEGAGLYAVDSVLDVVNNTVADNKLTEGATMQTGGSMVMDGSKPSAFGNNIVWGNTGDPAGEVPMFVNPAAGDYRLKPGSPYIDAGYDGYTLSGETDPDGHPRRQGLRVDSGAYESTATVATPLSRAYRALRIVAGLQKYLPGDDPLDTVSGSAAMTIDIRDAIRLLRRSLGKDPG